MRKGFRDRHPAELVVMAFAAAILLGAVLLMMPFATVADEGTSVLTALFTATSAVCVTGLIVVDTPTHWSAFGEVVIMVLIQLGGFGMMTLASLVAIFVSHRLGLRQRMLAQVERGALALGDVRRVLLGVLKFTLMFEAAAAALLAARFALAYDEGLGDALYLGAFHSVSAFNNAGFALYTDNLIGFATDPWVSLTIMVTFVAGGLGFPVLLELRRRLRQPSHWSLHTKLTLLTTAVLLAAGAATVIAFEWSNPDTLGTMDTGGKLLAGTFQGATPRTAGFNSLDYADVSEPTILVTTALMFIGAGSASTAGGIKVTTFALLAFVIWSEMRGEPEVQAFGRRVPASAQRQALTIALVGLGAVVAGTLFLLASQPLSLSQSLFEAASAFGTVGLSTGITYDLKAVGQVVLVALMFLGRVGPATLATALVLRERRRLYRYPEERPIIG